MTSCGIQIYSLWTNCEGKITLNISKHCASSNISSLLFPRIKKSMESYLDKVDKPYSKYINWPSCDSTDWMWRYWGQNYNRLLDIKVRDCKMWP